MMNYYRKTTAEISFDNLDFNLKKILNIAGPDRFICPMVKANAYGHGATHLGKFISQNYGLPLGVALIEEAVELRNADIESEILVFSDFDKDGAKKIIEAKLTPIVSQMSQLKILEQYCDKNISVHIKFNTGMNRLGFTEQDIKKLCDFFNSHPKVKLTAILSHLHSAHLLDQYESASLKQIKQMLYLLDSFKEFGVFSHLLNSDGIAMLAKNKNNKDLACLNQPNWGFRPGVMTFGYCSNEIESNILLKPVMTLKSQVQSLQKIKTGETVSYNATWTAHRSSLIGIVPIGYADGIHRSISNQGHVFIKDKKVSIIGKVCMDYLMIDLTEFQDKGMTEKDLVNSEVFFFGEKKEAGQDADDFARLSNTISYEVLTSVSARIPRIYKHGVSS